MSNTTIDFIHKSAVSKDLIGIADKVITGARITVEDQECHSEIIELGPLL